MIVSQFDELPQQYSKALTDATTLPKLRETVRLYGEVAFDAVQVVESMSDGDFIDWRAALQKERKGIFMGEDAAARFMPVLLPEVMFRISEVAHRFKVPWGLAYCRLKDVGRLKIKDGIAELNMGEGSAT